MVSRSTWACELKCLSAVRPTAGRLSRSTWACELKLLISGSTLHSHFVTLHVSVWVEIYSLSKKPLNSPVTLHVSVWVEMPGLKFLRERLLVTLHVSVWVEISTTSATPSAAMSRSTWACELKCLSAVRPTAGRCHAPRERVSWNLECRLWTQLLLVTLHVSVWVEIIVSSLVSILFPRHAPRERVSWNSSAPGVLLWVRVTLHVSVWVEINCERSQVIKPTSRSTWACELK